MLGLADEPLKAVGGGAGCSFVPCLLFKAFDVTLKNCEVNKMTLLSDRAKYKQPKKLLVSQSQ